MREFFYWGARKCFVIFFLAFFWLLGSPCVATAAIIVDPGSSSPAAGTPLNPSIFRNNTQFPAVTNSYDNNVARYYLITQDSGKAGWTQVAFTNDSGILTNYPLSAVYVTNNLNTITFAANCTYFFDGGTYIDMNSTAYTRFSLANLSLVGLQTVNSASPTILKKAKRVNANANINDTIERYNLNAADIYMRNIIFDGTDENGVRRDAYPVGSSAPVSAIRGEYRFYLSADTAGFVMRDCILQNLGATIGDGSEAAVSASPDTVRKNVAIYCYQCVSGIRVFDSVTIRGFMTWNNVAAIQINRSSNNYFRNITIEGAMSGPLANPVRVNAATLLGTTTTQRFYEDFTTTGFQSGYAPPPSDAFYVYYYTNRDNAIPEPFRFVVYNTATMMAPTTPASPAARVCKLLPDAADTFSYLDLDDRYWIVRDQAFAPSTTSQLASINTSITRVNGGAANGAYFGNIKLLANAGGTVSGFTAPNYQAYAGNQINIVALPGIGFPYSATAPLIPFSTAAGGGKIALPSANPGRFKIFNVDFDASARYTLHEALEAGAAQFPFVSINTFHNCAFTVLAETLLIPDHDLSPEHLYTGPGADALYAGGTLQLGMSMTGYSHAATGYTGLPESTISDRSVLWESSDPLVATVDANGLVTLVSAGQVTITCTALDAHNEGYEGIQKPLDYVTLNVQAANGTSVTARKVWVGGSELSASAQLMRNGAPLDAPVILSRENAWTYTWNNLSLEDIWTVDEPEVPPRYIKTVGQEGNVFTITNTKIGGGNTSGDAEDFGGPTDGKLPRTGDASGVEGVDVLAALALAVISVLLLRALRGRGTET